MCYKLRTRRATRHALGHPQAALVIIRLSKTLSLMASYLYQRGETFHFRLRVPQELHDRYPKPVIRKSLKTTDPREAARLADAMFQQYQASFSAMRGNASLTPSDTLRAAQVLADSLPPLEHDTDYFEEKFRAYVHRKGLDPLSLEQNPEMVKESDYLGPVDLKALQLLKAGSDPKPRLSAALDIYVSTHRNADSKKAMERAKRDWGQLEALAGDICIADLGREHARAFVAQCAANGMKTATARRAVNTLCAVLNVAIRELDIRGAFNPFAAVPIANEGRDAKEVKTPSPEELAAVLGAFGADRAVPALLILIQMGTGARIAEVSGLAVADVVLTGDVPHLTIQDQPWRTLKTDTSKRDVPLVGFALEAAKVAVSLASKGSPALFPRYAKAVGGATASAAVNKRLKPWAFGSHGFRHGLKDILREVGCPEPIQKEIQGHAGDGISAGYGKGYSLKVKHEWLTKAQAHITNNTKQA